MPRSPKAAPRTSTERLILASIQIAKQCHKYVVQGKEAVLTVTLQASEFPHQGFPHLRMKIPGVLGLD